MKIDELLKKLQNVERGIARLKERREELLRHCEHEVVSFHHDPTKSGLSGYYCGLCHRRAAPKKETAQHG